MIQTCHTWSPGTLGVKGSEPGTVSHSCHPCEKGRGHRDVEGNMLSGWSETLLIHGEMCWYFQYVHFVYVWIISQHLELVKENKKCNFPQRLKDWESGLGVSHTELFNDPTNLLKGLWADVLQGDREASCRPCLHSLWQSQRWIGSCWLRLLLRMALSKVPLWGMPKDLFILQITKDTDTCVFQDIPTCSQKVLKFPFYLPYTFSFIFLIRCDCCCRGNHARARSVMWAPVQVRPSGTRLSGVCTGHHNLILFYFLQLGRFCFLASVIWEWPCDFFWQRKCEWRWCFGEMCLVAGSKTPALPSNRGNLDSVSGHVYHCISLEGQWPQRRAADCAGETSVCYVDDISGWWLLQILWLIWMKALTLYIFQKRHISQKTQEFREPDV